MRTCPSCSADISQRDSRARYCSDDVCFKRRNALKSKRCRDTNPEGSRRTWRKYSVTPHGKASMLLNYARDRANRQNIPFELDHQFIMERLATNRCEVTGLEFDPIPLGNRKPNPMTPSIDKKVPSKGYTKENVRFVCFLFNIMKHSWTDDDLLRVAQAIVENSDKLELKRDL